MRRCPVFVWKEFAHDELGVRHHGPPGAGAGGRDRGPGPAIQAEKPGERLDVHAGSAELDRLVETLNDMLDRIETAMRTARRFAADASHELQTPLAAMRSVVEACARRARGVEDYHAMAADLLVEIDRSSRLVRDLRLLALADGGQVVTAGDRIDLATVVSECSEIARAMAEEKAIGVDARIEQRPIILGSALHLRRVILNLTDNAIRYSPPGASMEIRVAGANGQASVCVSDHGCGIAPRTCPTSSRRSIAPIPHGPARPGARASASPSRTRSSEPTAAPLRSNRSRASARPSR